MQTKKASKTLLIAAVIFITGAAVAFAQGGWGRGNMMNGRGGDGYGMGIGEGYGPEDCPNYRGSNLTDEQLAQVKAARDKFFQETETLRQDIQDKRIALNDALNAANPDQENVVALQKELSGAKSRFDEKAIQHRLEMRKLLPEGAYQGCGAGRGYKRGMGRGI